MKRIFLSLVLVLGTLSLVNAQEKAIGLKFGTGVDLTYQQMLGDANRLELNLGLNGFDEYDPFILSGAYQWVWDLSDKLAPGFKWYAGAGALLGFSSYDIPVVNEDFSTGSKSQTDFWVAVIGNVGIEYNISSVPVQIALDWTPTLFVTPDVDFGADGIRLAARYKF